MHLLVVSVGCVMRLQSSSFNARFAIRIAFAGISAALLAGCAESDRFSSDPLGNPFGSTARAPQAAPSPAYAQAAPVSPVQSRPLVAPVQSRPLGPVASYSAPARPSPHLAAAPLPAGPDMTASVKRGGPVGWSAEGGMPIIVAHGENAETIAKRYGVPTDALLRANGFSSAGQVGPGTRLVIPIYNASLAASSGARVASAAPAAPVRAKKETMHFVQGPQPAAAPKPVHLAAAHVPAVHEPAARVPAAHASAGKAPVVAQAAPAVAAVKSTKVAAAKPAAPAVPVAPTKVAKADIPVVKKPTVDPTPTASLPPATAPAVAEAPKVAEAAGPEFRWPARGRIIQGFKSGGNDGINIAVPEGTQVKAAENGVVAYAGSELKGYGNLVLIRHPNGFVSAYANNGDIEVKRGDTVKRGQTIAKSGQSGNVASPQLHFELRKGSTPVDPTQYLAGL